MINVYGDNCEVIGLVEYDENLSYNNRLGLTKLNDGSYVLMRGAFYENENTYGEIISEREAFQLIMRYNDSLLEEDKFKDLLKYKKELLYEV